MKGQSPATPEVKPVELQPIQSPALDALAVEEKAALQRIAKKFNEEVVKPAIADPNYKSEIIDDQYKQAHRDNKVHTFVNDIMKARRIEEPVYAPPPMAEAVAKRTNEELEAGRRMVAARAAEEALRPKRPVDTADGRMTPVFRPRDFVPDPKKNQGQVRAETVASS